MISDTLLDHFRSQMFDTVEEYLFSDEEIFRWMDDAQRMFCRLTQGISDVTNPLVVQIPVVTGQAYAQMHEKILRVRRASLASTGHWLDIKNIDDFGRLDDSQGPIYSMIIGLEPQVVRWYHVPAQDDMVNLMVFRLPLTSITWFNEELEIPEEHHLHLVPWMQALAYRKHDSETYNDAAAKQYDAVFREYCARVKLEQERLEYKPRTVAYGGI